MSDINTVPERLAEEESAKRAAEMKPAKEKLEAFATALESMERPKIGKWIDVALKAVVFVAVNKIREMAKELK